MIINLEEIEGIATAIKTLRVMCNTINIYRTRNDNYVSNSYRFMEENNTINIHITCDTILEYLSEIIYG